MTERARGAYVIGLVLGLVVFALAGGLALPPLAAHGDFGEQWAAARVALDGGDPYDVETWRADAARLAGRASDAAAFVYPPYVTFALAPLALLPLGIAATAWVAGSLLIAALGVGALLRRYPPAHPLVALAIGFAIFASGASLLALAQGQWDLLLLGAIAWGAAAVARGGRSSGIAVLLLAKPQLAPLALLGFARAASGTARRRFAIGVAIGCAAIALTLVRADWWLEWARGAAGFQAARPIRTATIGTLFEPLGLLAPVLTVALIALVVGVSLRTSAPRALPLWLATSVLVAPYVQAYDHALLIAPLAMATSATGRTNARSAAAIALAGVAILVIGDAVIATATVAAGHDVLGALTPLAIWLLVWLAGRA